MHAGLNWIVIAAAYGALAVGVGAFGAHGLRPRLEAAGYGEAEIARRLDTFETGAKYHTYTALALLGVGVAARHEARRAWSVAAGLLLAGNMIFSGLLYALTAGGDDYRWLGAVVPIGGALMIAGWVAVAVAAVRRTTGE